ncbi:mechanosensitive ion channel family protein [Formosa haliotis]|uniref:mechanosensitive ion channel family protein n=1 Tax=Formosa haliotis TaxID=1555194 RepID=UPI000824118D|nr:mechanosensitive ion channel domain-containing protein [Formosa haliotis]
MNPRTNSIYRFLLVVLCFTCFISHAQTNILPEILPEKADSTKVDAPKAIPLINIIQEIDNTKNQLKLISKKTAKPNEVLKIDSLYVKHGEFLLQESDEVESFIKQGPNTQKINNLISKWNGYKSTLTGWQSTIQKQEERNSRLVEDIKRKEKIWSLSHEKAKNESAPPEVLSAINEIWESAKDLKKTINNNNNYYLVLETRINDQINITENIIDNLLDLKNSDLYDIFYKRHDALWNTSFKSPEVSNVDKSEEVESIHNNVSGTFQFLKGNIALIISYFVFVYFIIISIRYLKNGFIKYVYEEKTDKLKRAKLIILNQGNICIIFLSLLAAKIFFANTPKLFQDILTFLVLVCSIPLIRPYMHKQFKNIIYFVILFFILDSTKSYIWFSSANYRIYILFEALIVIAILFSFTHPYLKTRRMHSDWFGTLLIRLTPIVYFLSIVSIVSNLFGYTNLTDITLKICTQGGILTTFFYSLLMIFNGIAVGVINRHYGVKLSYNQYDRLRIEKRTLKTSRAIIIVIWLMYFLNMIDLLRPLLVSISDSVSEPYTMGTLTFTLGGVLSFLFTLIISYALTKLVSFLINDGDGVLRFLKLPKGIPAAVSLVIRYFILGFGIILALGALGVDLSKFNLMAGALGLGIGFGLQTVISNFVSGLILVFERPILPGDTVEVNNLLGTVNRIGVRSSSISTFDGAEVVVPNNNLISNDLINWTLSNNTKRVEILIGTSYDSDPNRVLEILFEIAQAHKFTLKDPEPRALFNDFGDSSLNFRLLFWVHYEVGLQAKSDISIAIYNRFKEEGIEIPFPQRDLNLRNVPENFSLNAPTPKKPASKSKTDKNLKAPLVEPLKTDMDSDATADSSTEDSK